MKAERSAEPVREQARAKLNLFLDVLERRPDGYHEMCMVMQTAALCDEVRLSLRPDGEKTLRCTGAYAPQIPDGPENLAWRAAERYLAQIHAPQQGYAIEIDKAIPTQAGLAGGSADAAAVLRALNRAVGQPLPLPELARIGEQIGSDVPYCVYGGTMLARGRGEILTRLPQLGQVPTVICKPDFSSPTPALFAQIDAEPARMHADAGSMLRAMEARDLAALGAGMSNAFEPLAARQRPQIAEICACMRQCGALGAMLTGTGSAVFGLFASAKAAEIAARTLRTQYAEVFLTHTE